MKRLAPYLGAAGLGFFAAGVLLRLMQPSRDRIWAGALIVGLTLLVFYLVNQWSDVSRLAGRRGAKEGANATVLALLVFGIIAGINYIANRHARQWDFTAARQYTLSDQTTGLLAELDRDVEIVLFDDPASGRALAASDLLRLYDDASDRVQVSVIDPEAEPERELAYREPGGAAVEMGTVVLATSERRERATAPTEPEITNALLRLLREDRKKIYFTGGHQEKSLDDTEPDTGLSLIREKLEASTYDAETLVIARSAVAGEEGGSEELRIPEDADAVVVAGPQTDFLPEEIAAVDRYLSSGGKAVFLIDPTNQGLTPALTEYLLEKGVVLVDDVVVDPYSVPPVYPVVRSYGRHPIVESFANALSVFPLVRSVERGEEIPEGTEVRELFTSEAESWSETRLAELRERQGPAPDQTTGPLSLAVAVTSAAEVPELASDGEEDDGASGGEARVVVVGDSDFIANELAAAPLLNADLFLNMVNWVAQDEDLISIRPREPEDRRIYLTSQQRTNVLLWSVLIIPGIVLFTGISVWWGRR